MKAVSKANEQLTTNSNISINASLVADTSPLLGADHDEEVRMSSRLSEMETHAKEGKAVRQSAEQIVEETKVDYA